MFIYSEFLTVHVPPEVLAKKTKKTKAKNVKSPPLPGSFKVKYRSNEYNDQIQLRTPSVLAGLKRYIPDDGFCLVGLTMLDQFAESPDLFVAGLADGNAGVALFSFARQAKIYKNKRRPICPIFWGRTQNSKTFLSRLPNYRSAFFKHPEHEVSTNFTS